MRLWWMAMSLAALGACAAYEPYRTPSHDTPSATTEPTTGRQIVVCGESFDVGRRVVLWFDADGFDGYRGRYYNDRLTRDEEPIGEWTLPRLQQMVDQVVIHYDGVASSARCYEVLQRHGLSAHFLLDIDGTIYQTLDLRERAWHATIANSRSVGIELAHDGAERHPIPGGIRGQIHGRTLYQRPYTDAQYEALIDLIAALRRAFPRLTLDYPDEAGTLAPQQFAAHRGLIGHYHISTNKIDPGPAFDWQRVVRGVRQKHGL